MRVEISKVGLAARFDGLSMYSLEDRDGDGHRPTLQGGGSLEELTPPPIRVYSCLFVVQLRA